MPLSNQDLNQVPSECKSELLHLPKNSAETHINSVK